MPLFSSANISYPEYRAISELRLAHSSEQEKNLRAFIVFGDLVASGQSQDIYVLEVVKNWNGPRTVRFQSSNALPLRGSLQIYFLLPDEFQTPTSQNVPGEEWSSADLLKQVRRAYAVFVEHPMNYAVNVLAQEENAPASAIIPSNTDPQSFFKGVTISGNS